LGVYRNLPVEELNNNFQDIIKNNELLPMEVVDDIAIDNSVEISDKNNQKSGDITKQRLLLILFITGLVSVAFVTGVWPF
jgi:hypothetical protein